jgi:hypothetical protein
MLLQQGCSNIRFGEFEFSKRQKIRFEFDSCEFGVREFLHELFEEAFEYSLAIRRNSLKRRSANVSHLSGQAYRFRRAHVASKSRNS